MVIDIIFDDMAESVPIADQLLSRRHQVRLVSRSALDTVGQATDVFVVCIGAHSAPGIENIRRLRTSFGARPVLVLIPVDDLAAKVSAFQAGADDCLALPFDTRELEARLEALVARNSQLRTGHVLCVADLLLDLRTLEVTRGGQQLHLYPASRKLLEALMRASPGIVTHREMMQAVWGNSRQPGGMLRGHIYELRRSVDTPFATKLIQTVPGVGYRIAGK